MSSPVSQWRRSILKAKLKANQKLILLVLADHMNGDGSSCYPGQDLLAEESSLSVRSVRDALKSLEEEDWIVRRERRTSSGRRTSDYYIPKFRKLTAGSAGRSPARGAGEVVQRREVVRKKKKKRNVLMNRLPAESSGRSSEIKSSPQSEDTSLRRFRSSKGSTSFIRRRCLSEDEIQESDGQLFKEYQSGKFDPYRQ